MSRRDVFICHASEDKERYINPLTRLLKNHGVTYWIDEEQLRLGEHLDQSIPQALNSARYGLVVFSQAFLAKEWTNRELQMIREREQAENQIILLPILEDVSEAVIVNQYGFLRNRRFLKWSEQSQLISDLQHYLQGTASPNTGLPYDYFLHQFSDLNAVMHWTARPIPKEETQSFFHALQRFFHGHNAFIEAVNRSLVHALDNLCRVLANCPDLGDDYGKGKLNASMKYCVRFLFDSKADDGFDVYCLAEISYQCDTALKTRRDLSAENRCALTIYLLLVRYLHSYSRRNGDKALHHEVGNQLHELFSITVPRVMAVYLPERHDSDEWNDIYIYTEQDWKAGCGDS